MHLFIYFCTVSLWIVCSHAQALPCVLVAKASPGWSSRERRENGSTFLIRRASERAGGGGGEGERGRRGERSRLAGFIVPGPVMAVMRLGNFNQDIRVRPPCTPHPGEINNQVWYPAGGTELRAATLSVSPAQSWQRRPYWDWADGSF